MVGLDTYKTFAAMNLMFQIGYDVVKYNFSAKYTIENFKKEKFLWVFVELEKKNTKEEIIYKTLCAIIERDFTWLCPKAFYYFLRKSKNSLDKNTFVDVEFTKDVEYLSGRYNKSIAKIAENQGLYPAIYNEWKGGRINLLTLVLLDDKINILNKEKSKDILIWEKSIKNINRVKQVSKYLFDADRVNSIIDQFF